MQQAENSIVRQFMLLKQNLGKMLMITKIGTSQNGFVFFEHRYIVTLK